MTVNRFASRYLNSQYGKVQEKIKYSILSGKPIIFLHTQEMEIVNYLIDSKSIYKDYSKLSTDRNVQNRPPVTYKLSLNLSDNGISWNSKFPVLYVLFSDQNQEIDKDLINFIQLYTGTSLSSFIRERTGAVPESVKKSTVIVVTPTIPRIPQSIAMYSEYIKVEPMGEDELKDFTTSEIIQYDKTIPIVIRDGYSFLQGREDFQNLLARYLKGLSRTKIRQIFAQIARKLGKEYLIKGIASREMLDIIRAEKEQLIATSEILTLVKDAQDENKTDEEVIRDTKAEIITKTGGLENIERYLLEKKKVIGLGQSMKKWAVRAPKGILVTGIPGSGKSMMAKLSAKILGLPLIRMDMGDILNKYVGESEHRMVEALALVEAMSPCVLWIDEIEKAFSGSKGDDGNGVTKRLFGKFLTWMQEKDEKQVCCFVFATANDISSLPPELFRSGRFDAKFSTYMPTSEECGNIFASHIARQCDEYERNMKADGNKIGLKLFDVSKVNSSLFEYYLNQRGLCLNEPEMFNNGGINPDFSKVSRNNKFFTGADIENVLKHAKEIYILNERNYNINNSDYVYDTEFFKACLEEAIMEIKTYGETDLMNIASCYAGLAYNNFTPASCAEIMPFRGYNETRIRKEDNRIVLYEYEPENNFTRRKIFGLKRYEGYTADDAVTNSPADEKEFLKNLKCNYDRCLYCSVRNALNELAGLIIRKRKGEI